MGERKTRKEKKKGKKESERERDSEREKNSVLRNNVGKKRLRKVSSYSSILSASAQVSIRRILIGRAIRLHSYLSSSWRHDNMKGQEVTGRKGDEAARSRGTKVEQRHGQGVQAKSKEEREKIPPKPDVRKEGAAIWKKLLRSRGKEGCKSLTGVLR